MEVSGQGLVATIVQVHSQANEQRGQEEGGWELQPQQGRGEHGVDHQRAGHHKEARDAAAVLHDGRHEQSVQRLAEHHERRPAREALQEAWAGAATGMQT